jgi:LPXTG-site transpeptidase (sortase) family protein
MKHRADPPAAARRAGRGSGSPAHRSGGYVGWLPFLCVLAAIVLLAASAISWVTAPNWGLHNAVAPARHVGAVPDAAARQTHRAAPQQELKPVDAVAPVVALAPFSIDIPAIKARAPIVAIGTGANNELDPPVPPTTVGWWKYGAKPGAATGTAVIAGHINYSGVEGTFARIGRLNPGDTVIVHGSRDGTKSTLTFRITGVRTYSKKTLPWKRIFDQHVSGRLALVTCGGPFDSATGNYLDNIVAYAVLDRPAADRG